MFSSYISIIKTLNVNISMLFEKTFYSDNFEITTLQKIYVIAHLCIVSPEIGKRKNW